MNGTALALVTGFLLDLLLGDPRWLYHPIRLIGNAIAFMEKLLRRVFHKTPAGERWAGAALCVIICALSAGIPFLAIVFVYGLHPLAGFCLETFWCYQLLATRSLRDESMKVCQQLLVHDLEGARYAVSMIVGRDTKELSEEGVTKATVETIAENTSDGVTAPMFYMAVGGAPLMFFYKAVNTMDSMVGYKNDVYLNFGRIPAKLDDVLNYLPARMSAWLMIFASRFLGMDSKKALEIFRRDRYQHASPNSAQTESVVAGALHVQLAGDAYYFGKRYEKPTIGDDIRAIEAEDIKKANQLMYVSSVFGVVIMAGIRFVVFSLMNI